MSQKEKENIVSFIANLVITIPYIFYIINRFNGEEFTSEEELKFWASAILIMIPIRIFGQIFVYIIFTIFRAIITNNGKLENEITDERDRLIELKGDRNSTNAFIFGFMGALLAVVAGQSLATMFLIIIIGGFISELIGVISKIYYYNEGI